MSYFLTLNSGLVLFTLALPTLLNFSPSLIPSLIVALLALSHFVTTQLHRDPFLSTQRIKVLTLLVYLDALTYGICLPHALASPHPTMSIIAMFLLVVLAVFICQRTLVVKRINEEYLSYSLPSKKTALKVQERQGKLTSRDAILHLKIVVKEGLQFRELARSSQLLAITTLCATLIYPIFGLHAPQGLAVFMASSLLIYASIWSIVTRATLHPGSPLNPVPQDTDSLPIEAESPPIELADRPRRKLRQPPL